MVDQSTLWLQYLEQLNTLVTTEPGEGMQAIYPFRAWDWGGQSPVPGSYSYEQWSALNVVPATPYLNANTSPASALNPRSDGRRPPVEGAASSNSTMSPASIRASMRW